MQPSSFFWNVSYIDGASSSEARWARDDDPLGVLDLRTHRASLEDAPDMYRTFQKKEDGCIKVVLDPGMPKGTVERTAAA